MIHSRPTATATAAETTATAAADGKQRRTATGSNARISHCDLGPWRLGDEQVHGRRHPAAQGAGRDDRGAELGGGPGQGLPGWPGAQQLPGRLVVTEPVGGRAAAHGCPGWPASAGHQPSVRHSSQPSAALVPWREPGRLALSPWPGFSSRAPRGLPAAGAAAGVAAEARPAVSSQPCASACFRMRRHICTASARRPRSSSRKALAYTGPKSSGSSSCARYQSASAPSGSPQ
jgi:hypothetical protein